MRFNSLQYLIHVALDLERPMKPRSTPSDHDDLFRARLDQILDTDHPLIRLADRITLQARRPRKLSLIHI